MEHALNALVAPASLQAQRMCCHAASKESRFLHHQMTAGVLERPLQFAATLTPLVVEAANIPCTRL